MGPQLHHGEITHTQDSVIHVGQELIHGSLVSAGQAYVLQPWQGCGWEWRQSPFPPEATTVCRQTISHHSHLQVYSTLSFQQVHTLDGHTHVRTHIHTQTTITIFTIACSNLHQNSHCHTTPLPYTCTTFSLLKAHSYFIRCHIFLR